MLYKTVLFIDKVNQRNYTYYIKNYVTAFDFISQMKRELNNYRVEGEDYVIIYDSEREVSDNIIEKECISIQPGVYLLLKTV